MSVINNHPRYSNIGATYLPLLFATPTVNKNMGAKKPPFGRSVKVPDMLSFGVNRRRLVLVAQPVPAEVVAAVFSFTQI